MATTLIVIPARFGSSRFPGKPLAEIAGKTMIERVAEAARAATSMLDDAGMVVATEDERIAAHCNDKNIPAVMTDRDLPSGSDRALAGAKLHAPEAKFIINLQGDAPFTPASHVAAVANALISGAEAATPCVRLSWEALDAFRANKKTTPHSGTTCLIGEGGRALWFSKTILPAIRDEKALRASAPISPVFRHVGLYGFTRAALEQFTSLPPSRYEKLEGLEQLRMLENGMSVTAVIVETPEISTGGVDTPEDLSRLEALIAEHGEQAFF